VFSKFSVALKSVLSFVTAIWLGSEDRVRQYLVVLNIR
jgi:hypothetical protein